MPFPPSHTNKREHLSIQKLAKITEQQNSTLGEKVRCSFKNVRKAAGFALRYWGENWYLCMGSFINTWKNKDNTWEDIQKSATSYREYQLFLTQDLGHFGYSLCVFTWSFVAGTERCFCFSKIHFSSSVPLFRSTDITMKNYFNLI